MLIRRQNSNQEGSHNPTRGEAKDHREWKGREGCVIPLGRSHQGRAEAGDSLTMISHGVEISIARGGADEKDERVGGVFFFFIFFFFFFFYIIYSLLRYKKSHGALAMAKTKP